FRRDHACDRVVAGAGPKGDDDGDLARHRCLGLCHGRSQSACCDCKDLAESSHLCDSCCRRVWLNQIVTGRLSKGAYCCAPNMSPSPAGPPGRPRSVVTSMGRPGSDSTKSEILSGWMPQRRLTVSRDSAPERFTAS